MNHLSFTFKSAYCVDSSSTYDCSQEHKNSNAPEHTYISLLNGIANLIIEMDDNNATICVAFNFCNYLLGVHILSIFHKIFVTTITTAL